jgi:hypothetical protein
MNKKLAARLTLDLVFIVLLLCALMYRTTGDAAHEWIGISVFVVCIAHNVLNWKWYKNIFKGTYNLRRSVLTAINLLLVLAMATLIITGDYWPEERPAFLFFAVNLSIMAVYVLATYCLIKLIAWYQSRHCQNK